ncbi:hypothetical protein L6258_00290 [Candidatus Parcubacteria bacterium]|nr:hypothetical protein [Candidatus Parcubacteria bacterium]
MSDLDTKADADQYTKAYEYREANSYKRAADGDIYAHGNEDVSSADEYAKADADLVLSNASDAGTDAWTVSNRCANANVVDSVGGRSWEGLIRKLFFRQPFPTCKCSSTKYQVPMKSQIPNQSV